LGPTETLRKVQRFKAGFAKKLFFFFAANNSTAYVLLGSVLHFVPGQSAFAADADLVTLPMYRHADIAD